MLRHNECRSFANISAAKDAIRVWTNLFGFDSWKWLDFLVDYITKLPHIVLVNMLEEYSFFYSFVSISQSKVLIN